MILKFGQGCLDLLDIDLKTPLTYVDAAAEVGSCLSKINGKFTWYQK